MQLSAPAYRLPSRWALALGLGLLSAGCAGSQRAPGSLAGLRAGTTTLRVTNNVPSPSELEGVVISVDGQTLPLSTVPPAGGDAATVASLGLAPGAHSIAVRARARVPGGDLVVVGAQQPFHVQHGPAAIVIDVRSSAAFARSVEAASAAAPVAVALTIAGGRMAPDLGDVPSDDKDVRCAALLPIPHALCRAAADLDQAARNNDIVMALCVRDKLDEMRKLAIVGETGKGDSVAMAEAQVARLSHQVDLCGGSTVVSPGPDGVTVTRR
jgi:hypothetical protein